MNWFFLALLAAALWGGSYVIYEQLIKTISSASAMFYSALGSIFVYALWAISQKTMAADWQVIKKFDVEAKLLLLVILVNSVANLLILFSIKAKNATLAGMVEISYPLFIALFAWMFLKEVQASAGTWVGAALIFAGVSCIYFFEKTA